MLQSMRSAAKYIWIILVIAFVGGFLLVETSGLLGRAPVTTGTAVGEGNDQLHVDTVLGNATLMGEGGSDSLTHINLRGGNNSLSGWERINGRLVLSVFKAGQAQVATKAF